MGKRPDREVSGRRSSSFVGLSIRSTAIICAIVLITLSALVHEIATSKELLLLLQSTVHVEASTSIRLEDNRDIISSLPVPPEHFCVEWNERDADNRTVQPLDEWWAHHVEYDVVSENATHICFLRDLGSEKSVLHIQLYRNQFHTTCEAVHKRYLWSSGWGADFQNVIGGLEEALDDHHVPLIMIFNPEFPKGWNYAANKGDFSNKTCPEADLSCYFVPYHPCGKDTELTNHTIGNVDGKMDFIDNPRGLHVYQYVTRPLLWLRRSIFGYIQEQNLGLTKGQCSVIHVRRTDVVMDGPNSRKYYTVKNYVDLLPEEAKQTHDILLLTDDQNAISEAHEFFPDIKWKYLDRPRHNGTGGGWENHIPSRNPAGEVVTILGTFELVKNCVHLVHGKGAFSDLLWASMQMQKDHEPQRYFVDKGVEGAYGKHNNASAEELGAQLERLRREQQGEVVDEDDPQQAEKQQAEETPAEDAEPQQEEQPTEEVPPDADPGQQLEEAQPELTSEEAQPEVEQRSEEASLELDPEQGTEEAPREAVESGPEQPAEEAQTETKPVEEALLETEPEQPTEEVQPEQTTVEAQPKVETDLSKLSFEEVEARLKQLRREKKKRKAQRQQRRLRVD